jgi:hypothetical protein
MPSSSMWHSVALVSTDVSEESITHIIRVEISELGATLANASYFNVATRSPILPIMTIKLIRSPETSILTRATRRHIPDDDILHWHHTPQG